MAKRNYEWDIISIKKQGKSIRRVFAPDKEAAIKIAIREFKIEKAEQQKKLTAHRIG
jgi:hypothetical protein